MPDAQGNLKGQGWSRKREEGWERAFGRNPSASGSDSSCEHYWRFDVEMTFAWCERCGARRVRV